MVRGTLKVIDAVSLVLCQGVVLERPCTSAIDVRLLDPAMKNPERSRNAPILPFSAQRGVVVAEAASLLGCERRRNVPARRILAEEKPWTRFPSPIPCLVREPRYATVVVVSHCQSVVLMIDLPRRYAEWNFRFFQPFGRPTLSRSGRVRRKLLLEGDTEGYTLWARQKIVISQHLVPQIDGRICRRAHVFEVFEVGIHLGPIAILVDPDLCLQSRKQHTLQVFIPTADHDSDGPEPRRHQQLKSKLNNELTTTQLRLIPLIQYSYGLERVGTHLTKFF